MMLGTLANSFEEESSFVKINHTTKNWVSDFGNETCIKYMEVGSDFSNRKSGGKKTKETNKRWESVTYLV